VQQWTRSGRVANAVAYTGKWFHLESAGDYESFSHMTPSEIVGLNITAGEI
jgi:hypothetical protein